MAKRDLILNNVGWKIASFFLAMIVWFMVQRANSGDNPFQTLMVTRRFATHELSVMRDAADKRPVRVNPAKVEVVVSVPVINATFTEDDIQTYVDFSSNQDTSRPY